MRKILTKQLWLRIVYQRKQIYILLSDLQGSENRKPYIPYITVYMCIHVNVRVEFLTSTHYSKIVGIINNKISFVFSIQNPCTYSDREGNCIEL